MDQTMFLPKTMAMNNPTPSSVLPFALPAPVYTTLITMFVLIAVFLSTMLLIKRFDTSPSIFLTPQLVLSIFIIVGFLGVTAYATRNELPQSEAAGQLMGGLIGGFALVLSYWFGPRRPDS
jgi:hypothetical protein